MSVLIGLDIGGTKLIVAAASSDGDIVVEEKHETPVDRQEGLDLLMRSIRRVSDGNGISAIGAAIGGPLDYKTGRVSPLHQPNWRDVPLKAIMEAEFKCPFFVDVDTNVAALGEYSEHEAVDKLLYITLSTGMGGGFIVNGAIYRGAEDEHPEIGHQSIHFKCSHPERIVCECGAPNCLEGLISGNAIRRIYQKPPEDLHSQEWEEIAYNLGQGLRNLTVIYAPDLIALGGGIVIGKGKWLIERAEQVLREHVRLVRFPRITISRLGYKTALIGAIRLARSGI